MAPCVESRMESGKFPVDNRHGCGKIMPILQHAVKNRAATAASKARRGWCKPFGRPAAASFERARDEWAASFPLLNDREARKRN